jgi:pimeloyl-ACP methyl ester carboxylesterase
VLLHGAGDNARDWSYAIPLLDRSHQVLFPTCPATAPAAPRPATTPPPAWPASSPRFMDAVGLDQAAVAGNSLGGLVALQLALSQAERITALCLVDSAGLGRAVNPALIAQRLPGVGELAVAVGAAAPGAALWAVARAALLFGRPWRTPRSWLVEQYRAARQPGFLEATLASLCAVLGPLGQRQVLAKRLGKLPMPTLVIWGTADWVIPSPMAGGRCDAFPQAGWSSCPGVGMRPRSSAPHASPKRSTSSSRPNPPRRPGGLARVALRRNA